MQEQEGGNTSSSTLSEMQCGCRRLIWADQCACYLQKLREHCGNVLEWLGIIRYVPKYFGRYSGFPDLSQKYLDQISLYRVFHDVGYKWLRRHRLPRESPPADRPLHLTSPWSYSRCHSASRGRKDGSIPYIRNINDTDEKSNTVYVLLPIQACY